MWKKPAEPTPAPRPAAETTRPEPRAQTSKSRIGAGLVIHGDVQGQEDLVVEGRVQGKILLEQHSVFVEAGGKVDADISARVVRVAGEVRGNITASEQAVLVETARLEGNITASGVTIETGARFKGSIDMDDAAAKTSTSTSSLPRREPLTAVPAKPNGGAKPVGVA